MSGHRPPADSRLRDMPPVVRWVYLRATAAYYAAWASVCAVHIINSDDRSDVDSDSFFDELYFAEELRDAAARIEAAVERRLGAVRLQEKLLALRDPSGRTEAEAEAGRLAADRIERRRAAAQQ